MIQRKRFLEIDSFAVYYGPGSLKDLAEFDAVILEPGNHAPADVEWLKKQGTLVMAYVSVMEVGERHVLWPRVTDDMILCRQGVPVKQDAYGTFLMDLTSSRWKGLLSHHIGALIAREKYDGFFLDTIGDVEAPNLPKQSELIKEAVEWVRNVRKWFPNAVIVQNNGLEILCQQTTPMLDGITWENPPLELKSAEGWVARIVERLDSLRKSHELKVMVLFDGSENMSRKEWILRSRFADQNQYIAYFAPTHFIGDVNAWRGYR